MRGKDAEHISCTNTEYHARDEIGASMLETFRRSRREYQSQYITKTVQRGPSDAMKLGSLVHCLFLEPDTLSEEFAEIPQVAPDGKPWTRRKGSAHEAWWQEFLASCEGKTVVSMEMVDEARQIVDAMRANPKLMHFFDRDGQPEYSIFWTDRDTGLRLKCRVDWWSDTRVDLKTAADPSPSAYSRALVRFGYHRKLSHYMDGMEAMLGERVPLLHCAIGTAPPYFGRVGMYEIDDHDPSGARYRLGEIQRRQTLVELAHCMETGDWSEPWERRVFVLRLPNYAFYEDEFRIGD